MYVTYFKHLFAISQLSKGTGSSCEQGRTLKKKIGGGVVSYILGVSIVVCVFDNKMIMPFRF